MKLIETLSIILLIVMIITFIVVVTMYITNEITCQENPQEYFISKIKDNNNGVMCYCYKIDIPKIQSEFFYFKK